MSISFHASLKAIAWLNVRCLFHFYDTFKLLFCHYRAWQHSFLIHPHYRENGSKDIFQKLVSQKKRSYGLGQHNDTQTIFHFWLKDFIFILI